jgi:hypothetical protein
VVFRYVEEDRVEILMIQDRLGRWTIPKGHVEEGESLEQTPCAKSPKKPACATCAWAKSSISCTFLRKEGQLIFMTTYVFLMEAVSDSDHVVPENSEGIIDAKWFDAGKALSLIEYRDTERLFRLALSKLTTSSR